MASARPLRGGAREERPLGPAARGVIGGAAPDQPRLQHPRQARGALPATGARRAAAPRPPPCASRRCPAAPPGRHLTGQGGVRAKGEQRGDTATPLAAPSPPAGHRENRGTPHPLPLARARHDRGRPQHGPTAPRRRDAAARPPPVPADLPCRAMGAAEPPLAGALRAERARGALAGQRAARASAGRGRRGAPWAL